MAQELGYIKEVTGQGPLMTARGTSGSLLIPTKIADTLIECVARKIVPRSEAAIYFGPGDIPGTTISFNLEDESTMSVRTIAEGAGIIVDSPLYSVTTMTPIKYGVAIRTIVKCQKCGTENDVSIDLVKQFFRSIYI